MLRQADAGESRVSYYDESRHGWWWYEQEPVKSDDKGEHQEQKRETKPKRVLPSLKDYTPELLWNMHPDDFQPLIKDMLKKAVQAPTVENVREFYIMVDIARMKSHVFQSVAGQVWQQYPELSLDGDIPVNAYGRVAKSRMMKREVEDKITESSGEFALIYFYSNDCEFCKAQHEVLEYFRGKYPWEVKYVEISEHPDLMERFDVKMTPYVMLIYRSSKDHFPVTLGVSTLEEIEDRIFRGIRLLSGEVNPESYALYDFQKGGRLDPSSYGTGDTGSDQ
jgi:conjugal transfer pilus assembly protein TraF